MTTDKLIKGTELEKAIREVDLFLKFLTGETQINISLSGYELPNSYSTEILKLSQGDIINYFEDKKRVFLKEFEEL